jgi:protein TonB
MPTPRRLRFGIGTAIAFSVLLHLAAAPFVRFAQANPLPEPTPPPFTIDYTTPRPIVTPRPTPTPRPARTTAPVHTAPPLAVPDVVRPRVAPRPLLAPHVSPDASGAPRTIGNPRSDAVGDGTSPGSPADGVGPGSPSPLASVPSPTPTPKATCDRPDVAARTISVVDPEIPDIARERGITGTVDVRVDLTETGAVSAVSIARTADASLDEAALDAARHSSFAPEIVDCKAQAGSYLFRVDFDG